MIHDLVLPSLTRERLLAITELQITLLEYAITDEDISVDNGHTACTNYLNKKTPFFKGYGEQIAQAIWRSSIRVELLRDFSLSFRSSKNPQLEYDNMVFKNAWLKRIRDEIENIEASKEDLFKVHYFYGNGIKSIKVTTSQQRTNPQKYENIIPLWQQKAGEFFLSFYKMYLERSEQPFPPAFFPCGTSDKFGRQEMLRAFRNCNEDLHICPACDESGYYTISDERIFTTLDHYFPKDVYPHFACHPYNLIPTCYTCNSSIKGLKDPLHATLGEDGPGYLHKGAMPYSSIINRKENIYLEVDLSKGIDAIRIVGLQPSQKLNDAEKQGLRSNLEILQRVYDIPGRWSKEIQDKQKTVDGEMEVVGVAADRVSEALFRRMRHFLGQGKDIMSGNHMVDELSNVLSLLLYYLSEEDRYKDPLTVPMLWILAALLAQENQQLQTILDLKNKGAISNERHLIPAALNEVLSWCGQNNLEREKREKRVEEILASVAKGR